MEICYSINEFARGYRIWIKSVLALHGTYLSHFEATVVLISLRMDLNNIINSYKYKVSKLFNIDINLKCIALLAEVYQLKHLSKRF